MSELARLAAEVTAAVRAYFSVATHMVVPDAAAALRVSLAAAVAALLDTCAASPLAAPLADGTSPSPSPNFPPCRWLRRIEWALPQRPW